MAKKVKPKRTARRVPAAPRVQAPAPAAAYADGRWFRRREARVR